MTRFHSERTPERKLAGLAAGVESLARRPADPIEPPRHWFFATYDPAAIAIGAFRDQAPTDVIGSEAIGWDGSETQIHINYNLEVFPAGQWRWVLGFESGFAYTGAGTPVGKVAVRILGHPVSIADEVELDTSQAGLLSGTPVAMLSAVGIRLLNGYSNVKFTAAQNVESSSDVILSRATSSFSYLWGYSLNEVTEDVDLTDNPQP